MISKEDQTLAEEKASEPREIAIEFMQMKHDKKKTKYK